MWRRRKSKRRRKRWRRKRKKLFRLGRFQMKAMYNIVLINVDFYKS